MREVVERLIAKGLIGFKPPPGSTEDDATEKARLLKNGLQGLEREKADRAYEAARKRRVLGYKEWRPRGPGRPPKDSGFCRWCGKSGGRHSKGCMG